MKLLLGLCVLFTLTTAHSKTACALVGSHAPSDSVSQLDTWKRYVVKGEEFSVLLPELPAMSTGSSFVNRLNKSRRERVLGAYNNGMVFAIYTFDNPQPRHLLQEVVDELREKNPSLRDLIFHRDLMVNGFPGKEYAAPGQPVRRLIQFFATATHLYFFDVLGAADASDPRFAKFFSSLSFGDDPKGETIIDGPGAEQVSSSPSTTSSEPDKNTETTERQPQVFTGREVAEKARVGTKPEPRYTEQARRNQVTGTVVLKVVFSSEGRITNIRTVSGLPDGLTANAIAAARQIRFIPAIKDGKFVSVWMQLEYNFNLY